MNPIKACFCYYKALKLVYRSFSSLIHLPKANDLNFCYGIFNSETRLLTDSSTLDLGCGLTPKNPFNAKNTFGIDIRSAASERIKNADLAIEGIPFEDSKFDYITAYDFLEHIPRVVYSPARRFPFVELMNEIYRSLKPGGIFLSHTPIYPFPESFQDPTHVNFLTERTFPMYFDDKIMYGKMYGFKGSFKVLYQVIHGPHLVSILEKV